MNPTGTQSVYDDPRITSARASYETADRQATSTEASATSLPTLLKDALTKKFSADNPLVQDRERKLQNYLTVAEQAPLDVTTRAAGGNADVIYTPEQQNSLIASKRAAATAPLSTANYLLGIAQGGMGDIIDSASRAASAEATRSRGNANAKRQSYLDVVDELSKKADEAFKERQFQESIRQFNVAQANKGSDTATGRATAVLKNVATDAKSGLTLKAIMQKYGTNAEVTPDDILRIYNTNSKYGAAKESPEDLANLFGTTISTSQGKTLQAQQDFAQVPTILDQLKSEQKLAQGRVSGFGARLKGMVGIQPDVSTYERYRASVATPIARVLFGEKGNLSNEDVKRALNLLPKATDTPEEAQRLLDKIQELADAKAKGIGLDTKKDTNNNDPLGLF